MTMRTFRTPFVVAAAAAVFTTVPVPGQAQWTQRLPSAQPQPRNSHAMAWDSTRGVVVLHGGFLFPSTIFTETWEWDGANWTPRANVGSPGLAGHSMAYDPVRQVMVSFGGLPGGVQNTAQTWEYDGTAWTQRSPAVSPPPRGNAQMWFDEVRGTIVLFGGHFTDLTNAAYGDMWEWNGTNWTQLAPATMPSGRVYHAIAYDSQRNVAVLFGGRAAGGGTQTDTWEWDGANWTQRSPVSAPSPRIDHEMAFDPSRGRCVVHSGVGATGADTWEWDGANWMPGGAMPGMTTTRHAYGFCWDGNGQRLLLFGGFAGGQNDETWHYGDAVASYTTAGTGCPGTNGTPAIAAAPGSLPRLGQTFSADMTGLGPITLGIAGLSDIVDGSTALPLALGSLGMPNCWLYVSDEVLVAFATPSGTATWGLFLPNSLALMGFVFHQQAATLAAGVNPLGFVTGNYGTAVVGP